MSGSTLDPANLPLGPDRRIHQGHGTGALGPSDSSDSGADLQGAPGFGQSIGLPLGTGTTSDVDSNTADSTAGPDVGDANLDSDTDSSGTGERASAARDTAVPDGADIDADRIESIGDLSDDEEISNAGRPGRNKRP